MILFDGDDLRSRWSWILFALEKCVNVFGVLGLGFVHQFIQFFAIVIDDDVMMML